MQTGNHFQEIETKMKQAGLSTAAVAAFRHNYHQLLEGVTGLIPEAEIQAVKDLPRLEALSVKEDAALLSQTVVLKLNGGLGTSMGLEKAKSLLQVKDGLTFLDFIAKQVFFLREKYKTRLRFLLMNSFSTSRDTLEYLRKYPELGAGSELELMQNFVPKLDASNLRPVSWEKDRDMEWCPPGHGDLYPAILGSGMLDRLVTEGQRYLFVSNSDNLGASLDLKLLSWFAQSGQSFVMEVAERTPSDKKGGHLAQRGKTFLLRESAQCPESDMAEFQNIEKHRFFNTNNLWIRLDALKEALQGNGGLLPLPLIKNSKTVDPRDKNSTKVVQLETAMGAAIELFPNSGAVVVPRTRFAPVKTTNDLLALRSDAYEITPDYRLELAPVRNGKPPTIDLDGNHYKLVDQLDSCLTAGVPSLVRCDSLTVLGPIHFRADNRFVGNVKLRNSGPMAKTLPQGEYKDVDKELIAEAGTTG